MGVKKVLKTAAGIMSGKLAVDAFKLAKQSDDPKDKLVVTAVGSVAASASYHLLKDDAADLVDIVRGRKNKLLE